MDTITIDSSALLAWRISNRIAVRNSSLEIEPVHLYLSILSLLDGIFWLDDWELTDYKETIEQLIKNKIEKLKELNIDPVELTKQRRRIEKKLDIDNAFNGDLSLHRADQTREIFLNALDKSDRLGKETVDIFDLYKEITQDDIQDSIEKINTQSNSIKTQTAQSMIKSNLDCKSQMLTVHPKTPELDKLGTDLTQMAREHRLNPVIGRDKQIKAIIRALNRTTKRNVILIGEAGVGKTAVVEGLAQLVVADDAPKELGRLRIVQLNIADLIAGTQYRGSFEDRLLRLMKEVSSDPNLILFMDEIHLVVGAGKVEGGAIDIANILKPALARDDFHCVGATTSDEYERNIKKDPAFQRRFQVVTIPEPDQEALTAVGQAWIERIEKAQGVSFNLEVLENSIALTNQYIRDRFQPDKLIDFLENVAAYVKVHSLFNKDMANSNEVPVVTKQSLFEVLEEHYRIRTESIRISMEDTLEGFLQQNLIGQDEAINTVSETVTSLSVLSHRRKDRVKGILLFTGPTGVGKSYTAQLIASHLFPENPAAFFRISMNEYKERYYLSRLIGSSPGLIGHETAGLFFLFAEKNPQGVILLDEFEKAHEEIQDFFLQIFDIGEARNNRGRLVDFRGHLFIITTNLFSHQSFNFQGQDTQKELLLRHFRPEFLARVDQIVLFKKLTDKDYSDLFEQLLQNFTSEMHPDKIEFLIDDIDKLNIILSLSDHEEGARGFIRLFEQKIYTPALKLISKNPDINQLSIVYIIDQITLQNK